MPGLTVDGIIEKNKLEGSPWAFLFTFYLSALPLTILRYTNYSDDITFDGEVYTRLPMDCTAINKSRDSQLQNFTIRLSNADRVMQALLFQYDGFRKKRVDVQIVNVNNPDAYTDAENYRIESSSFGAELVEITLGQVEDVMGIMLPRRIFTKDFFPYISEPIK